MRTGGTHSEFLCNPFGQDQRDVARRVQNPFCTNIVMLYIKSKVMKSRIQGERGGGGGGQTFAPGMSGNH